MIAPSRRGLLRLLFDEQPEAPLPPERRVAWIDPASCLARTGCGVCAERCPEPGAMLWEGMSLLVDPSRCTGCGRCVPFCPAPNPTLHLLARREANP